jgi:dienelactone hydrolase
MTETELKIPTSDSKNIYGILRGEDRPRPLVILVHGLFGHMNEAMHWGAARLFEERGFATLRFNLYGPHKDARKMRDCTLKIHGKDIDAVICHVIRHTSFSRLFIAGHSYGFPAILHADNLAQVHRLASWDGTILPNDFCKTLPECKNPAGLVCDIGYEIIIGHPMAEEAKDADTLRLLRRRHIPGTIFIASGKSKGGHKEAAEKMHEASLSPSRLSIIPTARHNYAEDGALETLVSETANWFNAR